MKFNSNSCLVLTLAFMLPLTSAQAMIKGTSRKASEPISWHKAQPRTQLPPKFTFLEAQVMAEKPELDLKIIKGEGLRAETLKENKYYAFNPVHIRPSQEGLGEANVEEMLEFNFYGAARQKMAENMKKPGWITHGKDFLRAYVRSFQNTDSTARKLNEQYIRLMRAGRGVSAAEVEKLTGEMYDFFATHRDDTGGEERWEENFDPGLKAQYRTSVMNYAEAKPNRKEYADTLYSLYENTYHSGKKPSPGVITPKGLPALSDGHHGLSQAYKVMKKVQKFDPTPRDFHVILKITHNFSKKERANDYGHYLLELCANRKLYFSANVRAQIIAQMEELDPASAQQGAPKKGQMLKQMSVPSMYLGKGQSDRLAAAFERAYERVIPSTIDKMPHDGMRSFVGALLPNLKPTEDPGRNHRARLSNKNMVDFAEFYVAEWLQDQGFIPYFNEATIQLSPPDPLDENREVKEKNYIRTLASMAEARSLIYGTKAKEFRRDIIEKIFDPDKFEANKNKKENPDPRKEFEEELKKYTDYMNAWPDGNKLSAAAKQALAELTPRTHAVDPQQGQDLEPCLTKRQSSLLSLAQDLTGVFKGGSCLNPLNQDPVELFGASRNRDKKLREAQAAAGSGRPQEVKLVTDRLNNEQVRKEVISGLESGWVKF